MNTCFNKLFLIVCLGYLSGCVTRIPVSTDDTVPPRASLTVISTRAAPNIVTVSSEEGVNKSYKVRSGQRINFVASGSDTLGGIKTVEMIAVSGGMLREANGGPLQQTLTEQPDTSMGLADDLALFSGEIVPDSPLGNVVVRAKSYDFAGNATTAPTITITPLPAVVARLSVDRGRIERGQNIQLTYESENADRAFLDGNPLATVNSGTLTLSPTQNTRYIFTARNEVWAASDTVDVRVVQPPAMATIQRFSASPPTITRGQSTQLNWDVRNASSVRIDPGGRTFTNNSGNHRVSPTSTTTYTLTATQQGGTGALSRTTTVTVNPPSSMVECFTTPQAFAAFSFLQRTATNSVVYRMDLSGFLADGRITTVTNKNGSPINLFAAGTEERIGPNQRTSAFNGFTLNQFWLLEIVNPGLSIAVEYCTENQP
ncbi:hypothetical protein [Lewinella sp. IMCC34191]|uniref:hypothetical protein n=1 Tax=Lewinella sp. IMCC34191 TaxID=2259172 RepID=UPI001300BD10|nr:hypothetical protein [Lewinella sp. IMCC34191]